MRTISIIIISMCLFACTQPKSDNFVAKEVHTTDNNGIETITKYVGSAITVVHDTIDNALTAQEYEAVIAIRNGKATNKAVIAPKTASIATICKGTTKTGNPCKRHTKDISGYCFNHQGK